MSLRRGLTTEKRFLEAWADIRSYPEWLRTVRQGKPAEDRYRKTDAVMITQDGKEIPIQIKSSLISASVRNELLKAGVAPLSISMFDSPEDIRRNTLDAVNLWRSKREVKRMPLMPPRKK